MAESKPGGPSIGQKSCTANSSPAAFPREADFSSSRANPALTQVVLGKAYTDYEDLLEEAGLRLEAQRMKNSKRAMPAWQEFLGKSARRYIETIFSELTNLFPKKIHAVTPQGHEPKIVCFLPGFSIQRL